MAEQDKLDRQRFRELVKAKHREQKLKRKRKAGRFDEDEVNVEFSKIGKEKNTTVQ